MNMEMKMEINATKIVEEIAMQLIENQDEFIFETIRPYCEDILQLKINKEELKRILLKGQKSEWIPISEMLPKDGTWNIFTDGKNISVERYKYDAIDHFFPEGRWFNFEDAIAWMPLPDPYKEESKTEQTLAYADQDTLMSAT